jgi:hypothetical protein
LADDLTEASDAELTEFAEDEQEGLSASVEAMRRLRVAIKPLAPEAKPTRA